MKVRMRELRSVIRRVIAENDLTLEDFDFDDDDYMGDVDEDTVMASLEDAFAQSGDLDTAIQQTQALYPNVDPGTIDAMADLLAEFDSPDRVSGPASMRPPSVNQHAATIRSTMGYN